MQSSWRQILSWQGSDSLVGYLCKATVNKGEHYLKYNHLFADRYTLIKKEDSKHYWGSFLRDKNDLELYRQTGDAPFPKAVYTMIPLYKAILTEGNK